MTLKLLARTLTSLTCAALTGAGLPMIATAAIAMSSTSLTAQVSTSSDDTESRKTKRDLLIKLSKPITVDVENQPIADLFDFIADVTGAELEPIYLNDNISSDGIDPEAEITIKVTEVAALTVLERILARAQRSAGLGQEYTWQFTGYGTIEFGPKTELNRNKRLELYEVADLLYVVPDFAGAPEFDLQSAVQAAGGGGGGTSSPFSSGGNNDTDIKTLEERAQELSDLIASVVEPDQWAELGGDGATIRYYNKSFIITAPDYIHRQIVGYDFWPSKLQQVRKVDGRQTTVIKPYTKTSTKTRSNTSSKP